MKKNKTHVFYVESDLATIIDEYMAKLETPDGKRFKSLHSLPNTVMVKVGNQTFIISITDKSNAN